MTSLLFNPALTDARHIIMYASIALISFVFFILAVYSNLLREEISDQDAFDSNAQQLQQNKKWKLSHTNAPFSLTKVQFGIWTVIIASAYIYLSLCKGDLNLDSINKTALVLMGIFAGTTVASSVIDKNEINDNRPRHQNRPSKGFFIDILSDDNGISLHRFQNFAWTMIAIIVYLYKLAGADAVSALPELSDTLLALTGISSATYLVLKTKENDPPQVQQQNSATDAPILPPTQAAA
ncbi:hypothetical protein DC498_11010 [Terrimonas sp.]|uniref:hypothetical protein n=1 Tax=Terrimonas sp. TaxID=1914338 RepID=UPI000D51C152|nr:hypothetical protein [Terrimonas sp.]PVD52245.1 hypothetical protein DC498_11010 [Terrimonas sp.]